MKLLIKIFLILFVIPLVMGCAFLLGIGTGATCAKRYKEKMTLQTLDTKSDYSAIYNNYRIEMEKLNLEREKANLPSQPILTYEEWLKTQKLTKREDKVFNIKER